jgi:hypothetical protein
VAKKTSDIASVFQEYKKRSSDQAMLGDLWGLVTSRHVPNPGTSSAGFGGRTNTELVSDVFAGLSASSQSSSSNAPEELLGIVKKTATNGLLSAIGGGLNALGGIGSVVSGLVDFFGGDDMPSAPTLVKFQLPDAISQTAYVSGSGFQTYQGNVVQPISRGSSSQSSSAAQALRYQSGEIAQAVKRALLNSSTLSDVIGEI